MKILAVMGLVALCMFNGAVSIQFGLGFGLPWALISGLAYGFFVMGPALDK